MNCREAVDRINDLKFLHKTYLRLFHDPYKGLLGKSDLRKLIAKTRKEIDTLEELVYNMELDDSYDQNTGEPNKIYKGDH